MSRTRKNKHKFKRLDSNSDRILVCPGCYETLFRSDIEHFAKCPYCDKKIEFDAEIEDYLLQPVVERWLTFQNFETDDSSLLNL